MKQILKNKKFLFSIVFLVVFLFPQFVLGVNCAFISNRVVQNGKVWVYSNLQCRDLREHFELLPQNATMYPEFEESMPGMNGTYCWDPLHVSNGPMNTWPTDDQNRFCSYHCCFTTAPETPNQVIFEGQQTSAPIQEKLDTTPPKSKELTFTAEVGIPGFKTEPVNGALLKNFLIKLYSYLLYLSGVFAVIILILAGFQWVLAGGNQSKIGEAKQRIINALTGLVLLASSYLILYTINPQLINIKDLKIDPITPVDVVVQDPTPETLEQEQVRKALSESGTNIVAFNSADNNPNCHCVDTKLKFDLDQASNWNCTDCDASQCEPLLCGTWEFCGKCVRNAGSYSESTAVPGAILNATNPECETDKDCAKFKTGMICNTSLSTKRCTFAVKDGEPCKRDIECATRVCQLSNGTNIVWGNQRVCGKLDNQKNCGRSIECKSECCCDRNFPSPNECYTVEECKNINNPCM